ncbi:hypothetical protein [Dongia sp. agr-C8]
MGKHFISALFAIACLLLAACAQPGDPPRVPVQASNAMSWEWQSQGAFQRTVVLTLYQDSTALYETWGPLDSSDPNAASYRSETGRIPWPGWERAIEFDDGQQAPLRIKIETDGTLSAWWLPAGDLDAPDMAMRPIRGHAKGIRPIDLL